MTSTSVRVGVPGAALPTVDLPSALRPLLGGTIEAKIATGVRRARAAAELARDRALAHLADPDGVPLPAAPDSLEQVMVGRARRLPQAVRSAQSRAALQRIRSSGAGRRVHYGDLAAVRTSEGASVADQIPAVGMAPVFSVAEVEVLASTPISLPRSTSPARVLELQLDSLRCHAKVRNVGELDGPDEIVLSTQIVDATGTTATKRVDLGQFRKGDLKTFDGVSLASIPLSSATFPLGLLPQFQLTEVDRSLPPLEKPADGPDPEVKAASKALHLGIFGFLFGVAQGGLAISTGPGGTQVIPLVLGPTAAAVVAFVSAIVVVISAIYLIDHALRAIGVDEQFPPVEGSRLTMITAGDRPAGIDRPRAVRFEATQADQGFAGQYDMVYSWRLR